MRGDRPDRDALPCLLAIDALIVATLTPRRWNSPLNSASAVRLSAAWCSCFRRVGDGWLADAVRGPICTGLLNRCAGLVGGDVTDA